MRPLTIQRRALPLLLLIITVFLVVFLIVQHTAAVSDGAYINDLQLRTENNKIVLIWETRNAAGCKVQISTCSEAYEKTVVLPGWVNKWTFTEGMHGERYTFSVSLIDDDGPVGECIRANRMFLDENRLPDLPIVRVETNDNKDPICNYVNAPEGMWGQSISENDYVLARVILSDQKQIKVNSTGQIRIRGNTSAYGGKKPFKLKLDKSADMLLGEHNGMPHREWVLLPMERNLSTETAMLVGQLCGMPWQPAYMPVNVMLNGDWLGCYLLMEAVTEGEYRINVSENGFILENNAYWWKDGEIYFKTENQTKEVAFTFKYPDAAVAKQERLDAISEYMSACEKAILEDGESYADYIDVDSFVTWLMVHDIMGSYDAGGSNMFLYKYALNAEDRYESKLKMGPVWDFSSAFTTRDEWSKIHTYSILHYDVLAQKASFMNAYREKWEDISKTLVQEVVQHMERYLEEGDSAISKSMELDSVCWQNSRPDLEKSLEDLELWLKERVLWIDNALAVAQ